MSRLPAVVFLSVVLAGSAAAAMPVNPGDKHPAHRYGLYHEFSNAVQAKDLDRAKEFLTKGRVAELKDLTDAKALGELTHVFPLTDLRLRKETLEAEKSTLMVTGKVFQNDAHGTIDMVLEDSEWRVASEYWKLGTGQPAEHPRTAAQQLAIEKLEERGYPDASEADFVGSARGGQLELVKLFLDAGFSLESQSEGSTPLIESARSAEAVALYLIERGADVNAFTNTNMTAIMFASEDCSMSTVVKALLEKGARLDIESALGDKTALQLAEDANCTENAALIRAAKR